MAWMAMIKNDFTVFKNKTIHIIWKSFFIRSSYKTFQEIIIKQYESHGNHYVSSPNERGWVSVTNRKQHWDNDKDVLVFFAIIVIKKNTLRKTI